MRWDCVQLVLAALLVWDGRQVLGFTTLNPGSSTLMNGSSTLPPVNAGGSNTAPPAGGVSTAAPGSTAANVAAVIPLMNSKIGQHLVANGVAPQQYDSLGNPLPPVKFSNLSSDSFVLLQGAHNASKLVSSKDMMYVLQGTQMKGQGQEVYDPYTIGLVLGFLYEQSQFGGPPPSGYTIEKVFKMATPGPAGRKKRSMEGHGRLVFTEKKSEAKYWQELLQK